MTKKQDRDTKIDGIVFMCRLWASLAIGVFLLFIGSILTFILRF